MARPRSADFPIQREAIVRHAAQLFSEAGFAGTSMNDLARACGISKALLYHYVDDKYQLLFEIADGHVSRLAALVREVESLGLPPDDHLRRLITRFVEEYALARHDHAVLTQDVKFLIAGDRDKVLAKEREVVDAFSRSVVAARSDWQTGEGEPQTALLAKPVTMLLFGMMNWIFTWLRPDGTLDHRTMAPIVADLFLGGLQAVVAPPPQVTTNSRPAAGPQSRRVDA